MWPRVSIVAGLVIGIAAAALVIGGILFLGPAPAPVFSIPPTAPPPSPSPSASAVVAASPTPSPASSPSGSGALSHIGEPAPPLVVSRVGGGTIDLAKLKGQPVWV